jgi:plastocyanin
MKTIILSATFAFLTSIAFSTTVTITNSGTTFTPSTVTIQLGDTVKFQLASMHNATEVSQATWEANGNTPLPGFATEFGGGTVTGLTAGTHYYVCTPHASIQMKGKIIVNPATGIGNNQSDNGQISIYPNPTTGKFVVQYHGSKSVSENNTSVIRVYNLSGEVLNSMPVLNDETTVNISALPAGNYIVRINDNENIFTKSVSKQ